SKTEPRQELLEKYPWAARSPNGKINIASMLDINKWYVKNKMSTTEFPAERVVDNTYIDHATAKLGPFELTKKERKLTGGRPSGCSTTPTSTMRSKSSARSSCRTRTAS